MAKRELRSQRPKEAYLATIVTAELDPATDKWYFVIWDDEQRMRVRQKSESIYADQDSAHAGAAEWLKRTPVPFNFS